MDDQKRCNTCKKMRALSEFNVRDAAVRRSAVPMSSVLPRVVRQAPGRSHRQRRPAQPRPSGSSSAARLAAYFATHPCVDCGERDIRCLQFDHRDRSTKTANVACLLRHAGPGRSSLAEIEKCDVRCANCHSRTDGRTGQLVAPSARDGR